MGILAQEKGIFKEPISVFGKTVILIIFILFTTRILTRTPLVDYYTPFEILWYLFIISFTVVYALYIFMVRKTIDEINCVLPKISSQINFKLVCSLLLTLKK